MHCSAVWAEHENATRVEPAGCVSQKLVAGAGFEPSSAEKQKTASSEQNSAKSQQINALEDKGERSVLHFNADATHAQNTSEQQKCVPDVYWNMPADLVKVVNAWGTLDEEIRRQIVAMISRE